MKHLVVAAAILCASSTIARAQADEMSADTAKSWLAVFDQIVDTVVEHRADCTKMATGIDTVVDANEKTIARVRAAKLEGKKLPADAQAHLVDGIKRLAGSLDKCGKDDKVGAAFARLDLGGRGR